MEIKEYIARYYPEGFYPGGNPLPGRREELNRRNSVYLVNNIPVDLLFIGDSIVEWWEVCAYFSKFGCVVNRGIGGETTSELIQRFAQDSIDLNPALIVVSEGINDFSALMERYKQGTLTEEDKERTVSEMENNYRTILSLLKAKKKRSVFCSLLPLGTHDFRNELILKVNKMLQGICTEFNVPFADFYAKMTQSDGITLKDVTFGDMLHPHVSGYNIMAEVLMPILEKELKNEH